MIACCAGNFLEPERHIRLCPDIKLHIGIDREGVKALLADTSPIAVSSHKPFIDGKTRLFADGAWDCVQPLFHFLLSERNHDQSIAGSSKESQHQKKRQECLDALKGRFILNLPCI